jgi:hypothetical protein
MRRLLERFWLVGFAVGGLLCCFWYMHNNGKIPLDPGALLFIQTVTFILWPPSIMLMALSGQHPMATLVIVSISLSVNGFIYMGAGYILGKIFRVASSSDERESKSK